MFFAKLISNKNMTSLCYLCEKDVEEGEEHTECDCCESLFHLKCANVTKKEFTARKNSHCLRLYCPDCFENKANGTPEKLKEILKLLYKLDFHNQKQIERQASEKDLSSKIEETLHVLDSKLSTNTTTINDSNASNRTVTPAFSDVVKRTTVKPSVVIKPKKTTQTSTQTLDDISKNVNKSELNVCGTRNSRNGSVVLRCENANETIKVQQLVKNKLGDNYDVILPKVKNPRVKISNVDPELKKELIISELKKHNTNIKDFELNLITVIPHKHRSNISNDVVLEVKGEIFNKLMKIKVLSLPWRECQIHEHLYVKRCYKCCGFFHKSDECKQEQKCSRCAGSHKFSECKNKKMCCVNCRKANEKLNTNFETNHHAWNKDCPVYTRRLSSLVNKIEYNLIE